MVVRVVGLTLPLLLCLTTGTDTMRVDLPLPQLPLQLHHVDALHARVDGFLVHDQSLHYQYNNEFPPHCSARDGCVSGAGGWLVVAGSGDDGCRVYSCWYEGYRMNSILDSNLSGLGSLVLFFVIPLDLFCIIVECCRFTVCKMCTFVSSLSCITRYVTCQLSHNYTAGSYMRVPLFQFHHPLVVFCAVQNSRSVCSIVGPQRRGRRQSHRSSR